jgi:hypothetical protein
MNVNRDTSWDCGASKSCASARTDSPSDHRQTMASKLPSRPVQRTGDASILYASLTQPTRRMRSHPAPHSLWVIPCPMVAWSSASSVTAMEQSSQWTAATESFALAQCRAKFSPNLEKCAKCCEQRQRQSCLVWIMCQSIRVSFGLPNAVLANSVTPPWACLATQLATLKKSSLSTMTATIQLRSSCSSRNKSTTSFRGSNNPGHPLRGHACGLPTVANLLVLLSGQFRDTRTSIYRGLRPGLFYAVDPLTPMSAFVSVALLCLKTIGKAVGQLIVVLILASLSACAYLLTGEPLNQKHKHSKTFVQCHACGKLAPL